MRGTCENATIEFTEDMVMTLRDHFREFEVDGIVSIVRDDVGLWLLTKDGRRAFLGRARMPKHLS